MPRIKVKVERGNGLQQVITVDTEATKGATLGSNVFLPNGQVATPSTFLNWLGTSPSSSSGSGSSGPSISTILTTKGDLATRDSAVQRLPIGTQDQALRVSAAGMPEWRSGAALTKTDDTNVTLTLGGSPTTSLLAAASLTLGWTGQLGETRGGTAQSGYLQGDMLYASALNTLSKLGIGASGRWLGSSGSAPQWNAPAALTKTDDTNVTLSLGGSPTTALLNAASLTLGWTGQLAVSRGGTGNSALGALTKTDDTNVTLTLGGSPTTALVNAASLTLGWTGQLSATRGGTAQSGYLTGDILYASALNTLSKLGIGSSGNVLTVAGGVPTWAAPSGGASGANPTASVGLAAVNGVATTFLRSDGAPALDQGIAPTWTGTHIFKGVPASGSGVAGISYGLFSGTTTPGMTFIDSGGGSNAKIWFEQADRTSWVLATANDAFSASANAFVVTRSGNAVASMAYGNSTDNPTHTLYGQAGFSKGWGAFGSLAAVAASNLYADFGGDAANTARFLATGSSTSAIAAMAIILASSNASVYKDAWRASVSSGTISGLAYGNSTDNPPHTFYGVHNGSGGNLRSGTYTPTLTGVANVDSTTAYACQWLRVGNVVTVSGKFNVDATTISTATKVGISLPIASALTAQQQLGGSGAGMNVGSVPVAIYADATNDRAEAYFVTAISAASEDYSFTFSYLVL